MREYNGIVCPHCGHETGIEPALVDPDGPMLYCSECDEPLFYNEDQPTPKGNGGKEYE